MKVGIAGLGLIGGSLGASLRRHGYRVLGWDHDPETAARAQELGLVDGLADHGSALAQEVDVLILAVPVGAMSELMTTVGPAISPGVVVTDVGSAKRRAVEAVAPHLADGVDFVPSHPMAGGESSGPEAADPNLFEGATVIVCDGGSETARQTVRRLWEKLGARVVEMTPEDHDRAAAVVSHLPHLLAFALARHGVEVEAAAPGTLGVSGAAGQAFWRLAASNPGLWRDIVLQNRDEVLVHLSAFTEALESVRAALEAGDGAALESLFASGTSAREKANLRDEDEP